MALAVVLSSRVMVGIVRCLMLIVRGRVSRRRRILVVRRIIVTRMLMASPSGCRNMVIVVTRRILVSTRITAWIMLLLRTLTWVRRRFVDGISVEEHTEMRIRSR